ncbi:flavodoxin FldA [uncultured Proteiniphilum sp.]|uniref:flavodoxin FldA n=1 Tax=uncultured Proteiniphilum sp. TaxID=497637 RepID=UPI00262E75A4|nr:flavodoxin FldA [uncultured Proteiniphilum sp.]
MKSIAIIYGSSTGNTKYAAELIAKKLAGYSPVLKDIADIVSEELQEPGVLILGASTWSIGELQDDWETFFPQIKKLNLTGKTVALFGAGDAEGYPDTFADALGILYDEFAKTGCTFVGEVSTEGYTFDDSQALRNGNFVGLPLDEDNESDQTDSRIEAWVNSLKQYLD